MATLRSALLATRRDGSPDWSARVAAARALLAAPDDPDEAANRGGVTVPLRPVFEESAA